MQRDIAAATGQWPPGTCAGSQTMSDAASANPLSDTGVDLWWFDLTGGYAEESSLGADERARAARFQLAEHREHFIAAHCAVREILATYLRASADAIRFTSGPEGKPSLDAAAHGPRAPSFNLSHSKSHGALAVARHGAIGVDIEIGTPAGGRAGMLELLAPGERAAAAVLGDGDLADAFRVAWTRKEACLKAIGSGFVVRPQLIEAGIGMAANAVQIGGAHGATPQGPGGSGTRIVHVVTLRSPKGVPTSVARVGQPMCAIRTFRYPDATEFRDVTPWD
jgi:4'-phosphopantetheinyl transferase